MSARPGTRYGPLSGRLVSPLRVKHEPWKPANWEHLEGAEVRNGIPETSPYVRDGTGREAEVAAIVAEARHRADAIPGALSRCGRCGLPAAECAETACRTRCPEHGVLLARNPAGLLVCSAWRRNCSYEVQDN